MTAATPRVAVITGAAGEVASQLAGAIAETIAFLAAPAARYPWRRADRRRRNDGLSMGCSHRRLQR